MKQWPRSLTDPELTITRLKMRPVRTDYVHWQWIDLGYELGRRGIYTPLPDYDASGTPDGWSYDFEEDRR